MVQRLLSFSPSYSSPHPSNLLCNHSLSLACCCWVLLFIFYFQELFVFTVLVFAIRKFEWFIEGVGAWLWEFTVV
jgi:hypothetical protein